MSKITNPVVLIHKRENSDTYAVAITSGSQDYHDAVLMATMEPDMTGYANCWSKTGYYMAAEIERLKQALSSAESNLIDSECHVAELEEALRDKQALLEASEKRNAEINQRNTELTAKIEPMDRRIAELQIVRDKCFLSGLKTGWEYGIADETEGYNREITDAQAVIERTTMIQSGNVDTTDKPLTITLPDTSSKAFWSGTGKREVFHPESYKRWVKDAIERACVIAGIGVEVK